LQSVLRKALLHLSGPVLLPEFLPEEVRNTDRSKGNESSEAGDDGFLRDLGPFLDERLAANSENIYAEAVEFLERYLVTRILQLTGGNQSKAAKLLGITRGSLRNKTHALGIKIGQVVTAGSEDDDE
jgi:DNA-binding protein Fis